MSEYINNKEHRQKTIKDIIRQLHEGKSVDEVKKQFEETFEGVSASEISEAEGALIAEGLPLSEVQNLCDVHAAVFKGSIEEIHTQDDATTIPGHPTFVIKKENRELERIMNEEINPYLSDIVKNINQLLSGVISLEKINKHYQIKENLLFPMMEKHDITAPPKVMWGVDDEIRGQIKEVKGILSNPPSNTLDLKIKIEAMTERVNEMIFKEENIMIPMLLENLSQAEWKMIADGSSEIGYIIENVPKWSPVIENTETSHKPEVAAEQGLITLPSGVFKTEELTAILNTLPFDITFVNDEDLVKYFSEGSDRVFPRTRAIIGRNVSNCHPPASVHIVEDIVADFKSGKKDQEDFWINMGSKYILIRYYAVRNEAGKYIGVLEVTQDIKPIQEITGEKRLVKE